MGAGALTSNKLSHLRSLPYDDAVKIIVQAGVKQADAEVVISRVQSLSSSHVINGGIIASLVEGLPPETQDALVELTLRTQSQSTFTPAVTLRNGKHPLPSPTGAVVPQDSRAVYPDDRPPRSAAGTNNRRHNERRPAPRSARVAAAPRQMTSAAVTPTPQDLLEWHQQSLSRDEWLMPCEHQLPTRVINSTALNYDTRGSSLSEACNFDSFECPPRKVVEEPSIDDGNQQSLVYPVQVPDSDMLLETTTKPRIIATSSTSSSWETRPLPEPTESHADYRVLPGRWKTGKLIGSGSFGQVFQGLNLDTGAIIAIKTMFLPNSAGGETSIKELKQMRTEIELMSTLSHPNIVSYLGAEVDQASCKLHIFQEWVPGGSLSSVLKTFGGTFDDVVTRKYLGDCLRGLEYLHNHRIAHRDIKGENVLVSHDGVAKLADMGASKRVSPDGTMNDSTQVRGTPYYMSPEQLKQERVGRKADIWALGGLALLMATGDPPWKVLKISSPYALMLTQLAHCNKDCGPPLEKYALSPDMRDFLQACFTFDAQARPSATDLSRHRFLVTPSDPLPLSAPPSVAATVPRAGSASRPARRQKNPIESHGTDSAGASHLPC